MGMFAAQLKKKADAKAAKEAASQVNQTGLTRVTNDVLANYQNNYAPIEDALINQAQNPDYTGNFAASALQVNNAFSSSAGSEKRTLARYGLPFSKDRAASSTKHRGISKALASVGAKNATRSVTYDQQQTAHRAVLNIGQDTQRQALGLFDASAKAEASRNATNQQIDAQNSADTYGMIGTGLGIAASVYGM
ncbi:MAG: hypothetical protein R8M45_06880 [Ghiorsea sp.]